MVLASSIYWNLQYTLTVIHLHQWTLGHSSGILILSYGAKPHLLSMSLSILGFLLQLSLHLHQRHLLAPFRKILILLHSDKPQFLSMIPSHLQGQRLSSDSYILTTLATCSRCSLAPVSYLQPQFLCVDWKKRSRLNNASILVIIAVYSPK